MTKIGEIQNFFLFLGLYEKFKEFLSKLQEFPGVVGTLYKESWLNIRNEYFTHIVIHFWNGFVEAQTVGRFKLRLDAYMSNFIDNRLHVCFCYTDDAIMHRPTVNWDFGTSEFNTLNA